MCSCICVCVCVYKYWRISDFIVLCYILHSVQLGSGNLIGSGKKWREDRQARRIWVPVSGSYIIWLSGTSYTTTYILRTSVYLLDSEHEGKLVSLSRMYLYMKSIWKHPGGGNSVDSFYTHWSILCKHSYLHTLSILAIGLKEDFTNSNPDLFYIWKALSSPWIWGLAFLKWQCTYQQHTFTQSFFGSP